MDTAVQQLVNKGVIVFAVGIGPNVNINALRLLTPRHDLVYTANDFLDLYIKAGFIARQICQHAREYDFGKNSYFKVVIVLVIMMIVAMIIIMVILVRAAFQLSVFYTYVYARKSFNSSA